jgi:glycosyltransferase involved in cell wall biosynthesis
MSTSKPVRILQLVPESLPSFRADVAVLFGKYLPRLGVQCGIVGKAGTGDLSAPGFLSMTRPAVKDKSRWRREFRFFRLCLATLAGTSRADYDIIQVRDMVTIGLAGWLVARMKGMRYVYWVSYLMSEGRILRAREELAVRPRLHYYLVLLKGLVEKKLLYSVVLRHADHVFVQSEEMKRLMIDQGIAAEKLTSVPMGVDTETFKAEAIAPRRLPGWENVPLVAYLGTLDTARRHDKVLDALLILRKIYPDARLLLIGDSPTPSDMDKLRQHGNAIGLPADAFHITGWLPRDEAMPLLVAADAAISYFPRGDLLDSASPTKLLEYMALGIPAIGNDNPDQVALLTASQAGWLTGSDAPAFAQAMAEILADRHGARQRAAAGPAFIEQRRSYRVLAEQVAPCYHRLVAPKTV